MVFPLSHNRILTALLSPFITLGEKRALLVLRASHLETELSKAGQTNLILEVPISLP